MIHIYYGDGKGKTSAALGLALRACGAGKAVSFYSFLKDDQSAERQARCDIHFYKNPERLPFLFKMTDAQKAAYAAWLKTAVQSAFADSANVIILDEFLDVLPLLGSGFAQTLVFDPKKEYVITGHAKCAWLFDRADYITCMRKERHPYDSGVSARRGIEY